MDISQKNGDLVNQVIYAQAKHSSYYSILRHETQEFNSLPIDANTLMFKDKKIQGRYFQALYIDSTKNNLSNEFSYNLMVFYLYFTLTAIIIFSSLISLSYQSTYPQIFLIFHLAVIFFILTYAYLCLYLIHNSTYFLNRNRVLFLLLGVIWYAYLIIGNQNILFKIINSNQSDNKISYSIAMIGFIYYYRIILFDYHRYIVFIISFTLILNGILTFYLSPENTTEKTCEYLLTSLVLILQAIESYKVSMNSANIFYRLFTEEERNVIAEEDHKEANVEFISESEIAVEKCDKIIKEITNTKKIIIFKEVRDRLKSSIRSLRSIRKYLGRGEGPAAISLNQKSQIDDEDKQFIVQNFLNITKFTPDRYLTRNLSLKDLLNRKERVSYSVNALVESYSQLESLGSDWNFDIFSLQKKIGRTVSIIGKHYYHKWEVNDVLNVSSDIFYRLFENIEIVNYI